MPDISARTAIVILAIIVLCSISGTWLILKGLNEPEKTKVVGSETSQAGGQFGLEIVEPEEKGRQTLTNMTLTNMT